MDTTNENLLNILSQVRIGTTYYEWGGLLKPRYVAFDAEKMAGAQILNVINGEAVFGFNVSTDTAVLQNTSMVHTSIGASLNTPWIRAAGSYTAEHEVKTKSTRETMTIGISYTFRNQAIRLQYATPKIYYNCLTKSCKSAFDQIMNARSDESRHQAYLQFIDIYGTGCVTKLFLAAGSFASITVIENETDISRDNKYDVTLSVGGSFGGVHGARGWLNNVNSSHLTGTLLATSKSFPQNAPTDNWVMTLTDTIDNSAFSKLSENPQLLDHNNVEWKEPPDLPEKEEPTHDDAPSLSKKETKDLETSVQKHILKEEKSEHLTWEQYEEKQKKLLKSCTPVKVVKQYTKQLNLRNTDTELENNDPYFTVRTEDGEIEETANHYYDEKWTDSCQQIPENTQLQTGDIGNLSISLENYIPVAYEIQPWHELFPSLPNSDILRSGNLYYAKLLIFYFTRLQFADYMSFLLSALNGPNRFFPEYRYLQNDLEFYHRHINTFFRHIIKNSDHAPRNEDDYLRVITRFNQNTQRVIEKSYTLYTFFFQAYPILAKCPFGFVIYQIDDSDNVNKSNYYSAFDSQQFQTNAGETQVSQDAGILVNLETALRVYPLVFPHLDKPGEVNAHLQLFFYNSLGKSFVPLIDIAGNDMIPSPNFSSISLRVDDAETYMNEMLNDNTDNVPQFTQWAYDIHGSLNIIENLVPIGFNLLDQNLKMKGITPLFRNYPFELAKIIGQQNWKYS